MSGQELRALQLLLFELYVETHQTQTRYTHGTDTWDNYSRLLERITDNLEAVKEALARD